MKKYLNIKKVLLGASLVAVVGFTTLPVLASVTLTPTLVIIEGRNRYADVSLINTSNEPGNYEVSWVFHKMDENTGFYQNVDKSLTDFDLTQHLALTPKRVALGAQAVQKVRMGLRLKDGPPPPGDYRAHLQFREIPQDAPAANETQKGVKVGVKVNVGFSIPVVYRVGESDATGTIGDVRTEINQKLGKIAVVVPITRSESAYGLLGELVIYYKDDVVGRIRNANIFTEIRRRDFRVPLNINQLSGGNLRIVYKAFKKDIVFAERIVSVGQ